MRVMRVTLLMLPLALLLSAAAFGAPSTEEPTPLTTEQLEESIFGAPQAMSSLPMRDSEWWGVCSLSCNVCWGPEDCARGEFCTWACY